VPPKGTFSENPATASKKTARKRFFFEKKKQKTFIHQGSAA
jgi:hypothetical protein